MPRRVIALRHALVMGGARTEDEQRRMVVATIFDV